MTQSRRIILSRFARLESNDKQMAGTIEGRGNNNSCRLSGRPPMFFGAFCKPGSDARRCHQSRKARETGGLLVPSMLVMATRALFFFFFRLVFVLFWGFFESRASLSTWTSANSSRQRLFVFFLLLLSTIFILLLSLLSVVGREAPGFPAQVSCVRRSVRPYGSPEEKGGWQGSGGKEG